MLGDILTVGLDLRRLRPGASGGVVQSQVGVFRELFVNASQHRFVLFRNTGTAPLFDSLPRNVRLVALSPKANHDDLGEWLAKNPIDILFRSYPESDFLDFPLHRQIVYIPDNQHDYLPNLFEPAELTARRRAFGAVLAGAAAIATISEFSRGSLASRAPAGRDIFLMSPALQQEHLGLTLAGLGAADEALVPQKPYFMYPANLWPHKNHRAILAAFREFTRTALFPYAFVLTGDPWGWQDIAEEYRDIDVRHLGYVEPKLVAHLLRRATALVFFSRFEGFGIPVLEAFHAGTPVLCSNVTSLPEVAGDAALMADPEDVAAMAEAMRRISTETALRRDLVARGHKRLGAYSWRRSAENFMQACERVAVNASGTVEKSNFA